MTRIIAISDLHSELELIEYFLDYLIANYNDIDYLFITGDISDNDLLPLNVFEKYSQIQNKSFYVFGNNDNERFREVFSKNIKNCVDGSLLNTNNFSIAGLGGSLKTPFGTPNEYTEEDYKEKLKEFSNKKIDIFLLHNPPKGFFDNVRNAHIGSKSVLEFLERRNDIKMCLFGHVHEYEGYKIFMKKLLIKVPCFLKRRYAVIEFDDFNYIDSFKVSFTTF